MLSITDRVEEINRHIGSVNLLPIDISEDTFEADGMPFDPSKLDHDNQDKEKITQALVKMLKKVIEWVGKDMKRLPDNDYKMSY